MLTLRKDEKLQVLLAGAVSATQGPLVVTYEEGEEGRKTSKTADSVTNDTTAVDLLLGAAGGRKITGFTLYNADSATITVTIRLYNASGTTRILRKQTLLTTESLHWNESRGWYTTDSSGNQKTASAAADSANISAALSAGTSAGTRASTNLSTATAQSETTSSTESLRTSAGWSVTISKTKSSFSF